jgi:tetratricopeptide (TPR) repeat protein
MRSRVAIALAVYLEPERHPMNKSTRMAALFLFLTLCMPGSGQGQAKSHEHEQLGKVDFPNSCTPAVQATFQRAVAMLHSFRYAETEKAFREVLAQDPSCAIATWGIAAILMDNPLAGVGSSPQWAERAQRAIDEGRRIGAKTQRERDYIEAVAAYYQDWANRPERARQQSRAQAFETLAARDPGDDEAQIFYALYLASTQSLADQTYAAYLKAAEILEKQFAKHPDHPGVAHYLIHSYDAAPIAQKGVLAARRYAAIAPAAPHALHMPSHIFTRVGAWAESAATNARSATAAKGDNDADSQLHAMDYMAYAYLQLGRDSDARRTLEEAAQVSGANRFSGFYALAAIPARYAIERGDWRQATKIQPSASKYPYADALTHFARALGAARSGDPAAADDDVQQLAVLRDALKAAKNEYWATEVEVSRLGAAAWVAWARGRHEDALGLMRSAADIEDKSEKHIVTPGRIAPARELLGEMLLELKRPAEALKEFEASQTREPDRFRGLLGAARGAAQSGDLARAKRYFTRLVEIAGQGEPRPEVAEARKFLAAN